VPSSSPPSTFGSNVHALLLLCLILLEFAQENKGVGAIAADATSDMPHRPLKQPATEPIEAKTNSSKRQKTDESNEVHLKGFPQIIATSRCAIGRFARMSSAYGK
jgi:hypothetical protein